MKKRYLLLIAAIVVCAGLCLWLLNADGICIGRMDHKGTVLECLRILTDDYYSPYSAVVRSTITGWTMMIHGTNIYEDGTIDWDFSTNGYFSTKGV